MTEYVKPVWRDEARSADPKVVTRITLLSFIGVLVLAILAGGIWFMVAFNQFHDDAGKVRMYYPRGWQVKEKPLDNVVAIFVSPKETALDSFQETVNFSIYDMPENVLSLDDYVKLAFEQITAVFRDLKVTEKKAFKVAGHQGYRVELRVKGTPSMALVVYLFTIHEKGYNLFYMGAEDRYPRDKAMLDFLAWTMQVRY